MLTDDHEAVALRRLQDSDNPPVYDVGHSGAILGVFSFSQIDACKRHDCILWFWLEGKLFYKDVGRQDHWVAAYMPHGHMLLNSCRRAQCISDPGRGGTESPGFCQSRLKYSSTEDLACGRSSRPRNQRRRSQWGFSVRRTAPRAASVM